MAIEKRPLSSFTDYDEYLKWKEDPQHEIIDEFTATESEIELKQKYCRHAFSWQHSYITKKFEPFKCGKCGKYHENLDINFPPTDLSDII